MKSWLKENNIEMYSTHNEGKFIIAENFSRTLMNKFYKYMALISKDLYIDKSDDVVNKYNNTYVNEIKVKPVDIKRILTLVHKLIINILNLKLAILLEYENIKTF